VKLFDTVVRRDASPARHGEDHFRFLNRVDRPYWDEVRRVLEDWFSHLPADEKPAFRARFRSDRKAQTLAAFWELYLHELLVRADFGVTLHPEIQGSQNKPDFLAERFDRAFYLEATTLEEPREETIVDKRRAPVYDFIDDLELSDFYLSMKVRRESKGTPPLGRLRAELENWVRALDPDDCTPGASDISMGRMPRWEWKGSDWHLEFTAIPKKRESRGKPGRRAIGVYPGRGRFVDDPWAL
jgi:hypothetical protein